MNVKDWIIDWIFKNVKISTVRLKDLVDKADLDHDGFVDVGELVKLIRQYAKEAGL